MLRFHRRECFGECVGHHVISRAVDKLNGAAFHDVLNEMEPNVDMFYSGMILMVFHELDGRLINKVGLVVDDISSCILLGSKNPLGTDNVGIRRGFGEFPCSCLMKGF